MTFEHLGLEPRLLRGVETLGYTSPTPIQEKAIPHILGGADVVGVAQTGTGKTAAFMLPVLQRTRTRRGVTTLVVTPTRELALQIADVVRAVGRQTGHRTAVIIGGVGMQPQLDRLRRGVEVVVACPGRLLDVHARGALDLTRVETLILDEADRMLDMGFWPDVRRILALLPRQRQNLLFSATMSPGVLDVIAATLKDPVRVETAPSATPVERIEQALYPVSGTQKNDLLVQLLRNGDHSRTLVFTRTKHRADRVNRHLGRNGLASAAIHGDRSQAQRQRSLEAFKEGRAQVLVATDVVARGIDVDGISHVVNYDMPNTSEDYVHRIGRTARAGTSGSAVTFLTGEDMPALAELEKTLGTVLTCRDLDGFVYGERVVPDPHRRPPAPRRDGEAGRGHTGSRRAGRRGGRGRAGGR